jgi:hypothetical protein
MTPEEYIEQRLQDQINWYDRKSTNNQKTFKRLKVMEIVAAALIPFLSGIALSDPRFGFIGTIIVGLLGMAVTVIASFLSLGRQQEHWIEYRTTCESLRKEKFLFQTKVDPYGGEDAFPLLVQRVETLVSKENTNWGQYMMKPQEEKSEKKA